MPITYYPRLMVPMRDGTKLATYVWLPDNHGKFPAIVIRNPYLPDHGGIDCPKDIVEFCEKGIAFVQQAVRGTAMSEGEAFLWGQEKEDGEDFLKWLAEQEWFNGNMVTNGESYPGSTQWQLARSLHPVMKGLTPHNAPLDFYHCAYFPGGAYSFSVGVNWSFGMYARRHNLKSTVNFNDAIMTLPFKDLDVAQGYPRWDLWHKWMEHPLYDEFWQKQNAFECIEKMEIPAYITAGWFDHFLSQSLGAFTAMRNHAKSEKTRKFTRFVIEPLNHDMQMGDRDYGPDHNYPIIEVRNRFMENILRDPDADPLPDEPVMRFFVMGSNRWMNSDEWPLSNTVDTPFYLHGKAHANSVLGSGEISSAKPAAGEYQDRFVYNPLDPVPVHGGNNLGPNSCQKDQAHIEKRSDVLVYTSETLDKDLDVIGYVKMVLFAASSAQDTDFTAKLCDVQPDGTSFNVCDGVIRARYRNGDTHTGLIEPETVYRYEIDMLATAYTFLKGHKLRIQISSSNFPKYDRNPNTGDDFAEATEVRTAMQTILHDAAHPSHIVLPVFPDAR